MHGSLFAVFAVLLPLVKNKTGKFIRRDWDIIYGFTRNNGVDIGHHNGIGNSMADNRYPYQQTENMGKRPVGRNVLGMHGHRHDSDRHSIYCAECMTAQTTVSQNQGIK